MRVSAVFKPLIDLALTKLDWLIREYLERQRIVLMIAAPGTLLFLLLFWAFSGSGWATLALGVMLAVMETVLAGGVFLLSEKYRDEMQEWSDAADAIEAYQLKSDVFGEWKEFLAGPHSDPVLEEIRLHCVRLPQEFPPEIPEEHCGEPRNPRSSRQPDSASRRRSRH